MAAQHRTYPAYCPVCGNELTERYLPEEERQRHICDACGHIHYLNPKIVAGTIPEIDGEIWLLRRAIEPRLGAWTFPAGFMEMGETVEEAARRETREELNVSVELGSLLGVYSRAEVSTVHIVFCATATSEPTGGKETLEFARFKPEHIPWDELAFWSTHAALRDWADRQSRISF